MTTQKTICYEVKDWNAHFENSESRRYRSLTWVPVKNKHDGKGYRRVCQHPQSVQVFCAWSLIIQVASKMPTRGLLCDGDGPLTASDLSLKTGFPEPIFETAFKVLSDPKIGWLAVSAQQVPQVPAPAQQNPVNRTEQNRTEHAEERDGVLAALALRLNELYKRKPSDHWTYVEQSTLAEIARRDGVMEELNHILAYRRSMPSGDRRRFFPQSIYSFLSKWTETLDKARVQCPIKATPQRPAAPPARPTQSSPASATMLRESIAFLEREHPKSPMLEAQRQQLREMESK